MSEDEEIVSEEELEEARSKGVKRKRRKTSLPLPKILKYLNADEYIAIQSYILEQFFTYNKYFDSLKYSTAFDTLFEKYLQQQQPQQQPQPPETVEYREEPSLPPPSNPIEAFIFKVIDKVVDEAITRVFKNEKFQKEIEDMVRAVVVSTAEGIARDYVTKQLSQQPQT